MFCRYCGAAKAAKDAIYCQRCGKKYDSPPGAVTNEHVTKPSQPRLQSTETTEQSPVLFPVSTTKFSVMSIVTFGIYGIYWFYKNWQWVKHVHGEKISPFWRTFFGIFYMYSLCNRVREIVKEHNVDAVYSSGLLAAGYIVLSLLWKLPDPFWIVTIFAFLFQLPVVIAIQKANWSEDVNSQFTGWNIAGIVFGVIWWILIFAGMIFSEHLKTDVL